MLSKKTQYAFKALMYMAQAEKDGPILIAEIARKKKIPLKFLENILLELKNVGILDSKKGKGGGYFFKERPADITLSPYYAAAGWANSTIALCHNFMNDVKLRLCPARYAYTGT